MFGWFWTQFFACLRARLETCGIQGPALRLWRLRKQPETGADRQPSTSTILKLLPSLRSFAIAQRETNPTPSPASTADLMASVESSSITSAKNSALRLGAPAPIQSHAACLEPRSRISSGIEAISEQQTEVRSATRAAVDAISTSSSQEMPLS